MLFDSRTFSLSSRWLKSSARGAIGILAAAAIGIALCAPPSATAAQPKTLFDHLPNAWAAGTLTLSKPKPYKDGHILLFTAVMADVVYSPHKNATNVMLAYKRPSLEGEPALQSGDRIFAPLGVLPDHSYWRDNLPKVPKHEVMGGLRYVFREDEIDEAKRVVKAYAATFDKKGMERWSGQIAVLIDALGSPVQRLSDDAARSLAAYPQLGQAFPDDRGAAYLAFVGGEAPQIHRLALIEAAGRAKLEILSSGLQDLSGRDDATAAPALLALDAMGQVQEHARLQELAKSSNQAVTIYAYGQLGERLGDDASLLAPLEQLIASDQPSALRGAAAAGLGRSGQASALPVLSAALKRGDAASREAALAMAAIGGPDAIDSLKTALLEGPVNTAVAAIPALNRIHDCEDCEALLLAQRQTHPIEEVRDVITLILELPKEHKH